jgi:hypothetical protein
VVIAGPLVLTNLQNGHGESVAEDPVGVVVLAVGDFGRRNEQLERVVIIHDSTSHFLGQFLHLLVSVTAQNQGKNTLVPRKQWI